MKNKLIICLMLLFLIIGCGGEKSEQNIETPDESRKIEVAEHLVGGGYTFMRGSENGKELWIAVRSMPVEVGDIYYFTQAMEMNNFESKSLNKTFESILFVDKVSKTPISGNKPAGHSSMPSMMGSADGHSKPEIKTDSNIDIKPLSDGFTVETVNKDKAKLAGKTIKVKGKVTKYNGGIMNRNWIHIQDGTGSGDTADLTVTSDNSAKVGDVIIIEGTVTVDKDFGSGYFYEVIIEEAKITIDKKS